MRKTRSFSLHRVSRSVAATAGFAVLALAPDTLFAAISARVEEAGKSAIAKAQLMPEAPLRLAQAADADSDKRGNPFGIWGTIQDWLARANREYQGIVVRELSLPSSGETPEDAIAKTRDSKLADEARRAAEARAAADRRAEAQRAAETEQARKAADAKKRAEEKLAEDRQRASETRRLADEAKRQADELAKALSDAAPQPDPAAEAAAAAQQAERQRREAEKLADESRRQQEAEKAREARRAEERRKADEARRTENERRLAEAQAAVARHSKRTIVLKVEPIDRPEVAARPSAVRVAADVRRATEDDDVSAASAPTRRIRFYPEAGAVSAASTPATYRTEARWRPRKLKHGCRNAGRRIRPPARYVVKRGDSLWRISRRFYRNGVRWRKIYRANRRIIKNPNLIYPCQRVFVPKRRR